MWADASPKAGVDWLLSTSMSVQDHLVVPVMEAVHNLVQSVEVFKMADYDDFQDLVPIANDREQMLLILASSITFHRHIPIGLGSGRSSVEYKLRAMSQKIMVESSSLEGARKTFLRTRSLCVDMGTELSMADAGGFALEQVLPTWMVSEYEHLRVDDEDMDIECDTEYVLDGTLLVPGTCRLLHNLSDDVDNVLAGFAHWLPAGKAISHMLHYKHLRVRLVATLIKGTRFEQMGMEDLYTTGPTQIES